MLVSAESVHNVLYPLIVLLQVHQYATQELANHARVIANASKFHHQHHIVHQLELVGNVQILCIVLIQLIHFAIHFQEAVKAVQVQVIALISSQHLTALLARASNVSKIQTALI